MQFQKIQHYISDHIRVFEIENVYGLDLFQSFVEKIEKIADGCFLEAGCKVETGQLYPARFTLGFKLENASQLQVVIDFFNQISLRTDIRIDYSLIEKFFTLDFDFIRMSDFMAGVDLRRELAESSLDIALTIKDYPEKQGLAIALAGKPVEPDIRALLIDRSLHIGFDFGFNGKSNIELYPYIGKYEWQQPDIQRRLMQVLSPEALAPLSICNKICVGLSTANSSRKIYYYLENFNDFLCYFPANDLARKVHAYYQQQPIRSMGVCLLEGELQAQHIQSMNLYYIL